MVKNLSPEQAHVVFQSDHLKIGIQQEGREGARPHLSLNWHFNRLAYVLCAVVVFDKQLFEEIIPEESKVNVKKTKARLSLSMLTTV